MKAATREWLANLIEHNNNTIAIEVRDYIAHLESELKRVMDESPHEDTGDNSLPLQSMTADQKMFREW